MTRFTISIFLLDAGQAFASEWAPTISVDSTLLPIEAMDQDGNRWDNQKLTAENGLVFLFTRSTDW